MKSSVCIDGLKVYITHIQPALIQKAEASFSIAYKKNIQTSSLHYTSTLVARFLITDYLFTKTGKRIEIPHGQYVVSFDNRETVQKKTMCSILKNAFFWNEALFGKTFFSYSFTTDNTWEPYVIRVIAPSKIGIDAEFIKQRDHSLLQHYLSKDKSEKLHINKNFFQQNRSEDLLQKQENESELRRSFYKIWTAKEAIVKYKDLCANDIETIDVRAFPVQTKTIQLAGQKIVISIVN